MILLITVAALIVIGLPHVLSLERGSPTSAAMLWAVSLSMRAVLAVFGALYLVFHVPGTQLFDALTQWCTHAIVPLASTHLGLSGHRVGDAVTLVPTLTLAASAVWIAIGVGRGARAARRLMRHAAVGIGPGGSIIVKGSDVVLLAAGLNRPRLLVSAGALTQLEDDELAAGLDHERGHIARRHRFVLLFGEICGALSRFQPGVEVARRELAFQLERDADAWVLRRRHEPIALAGAICKSALSLVGPGPALALLRGSSGVDRRVRALVDGAPSASRTRAVFLNAAAVTGAVLVLVFAAEAPQAVASGQAAPGGSAAVGPCPE